MGEAPNRNESLRPDTPVPATGARKSSFVVGNTPREVVEELLRQKEEAYKKQGFEDYAIEQQLGSSSEGEVSLVKARSTGKFFAMKRTLPHRLRNSDWKLPMDTAEHHYPNEARILQTVLGPHPNVINLYETTRDQDEAGRYKLWMEYAAGGDLFQQLDFWYVKRRSHAPEVFLLHVIVELAQALAYIHHGLRYAGDGKWTQDENHKSVIHGDIKPDNVFLRWSPNPKGGLPEIVLADFGVSRIAGDNKVKLMPGTDSFHAPEDRAILGPQKYSEDRADLYLTVGDHRTIAADVYSFGQILYMMASKELRPREIGMDPSDIRVSRDYDTPEIRDLIVRCLAVDPAKRAEVSFHEDKGILPLVDKIREIRDEHIRSRFPLGPTEWNHPPPRPMRA